MQHFCMGSHCVQIATLEEKPGGVMKEIEQMEGEIYSWQVKIYDVAMEESSEEEALLKTQINTLKERMEGG